VFYYQKKAVSSYTGNSADAPTESPTLRSVLTFIQGRACMLETISAQPTATLRHQSVHNEESCKICQLGPHHLRACSRFQEMDAKIRRQAIIEVGTCTNCLSTAHKVESSNGIIHCYTKDRIAIQWPAQQPLQATTTLEDILCSRPPRYHYKGQPVNYKHVAL